MTTNEHAPKGPIYVRFRDASRASVDTIVSAVTGVILDALADRSARRDAVRIDCSCRTDGANSGMLTVTFNGPAFSDPDAIADAVRRCIERHHAFATGATSP